MPAGRPTERDRIALVQEFVEWAENDPLAFTVPQFWTKKRIPTTQCAQWASEDKEFRKHYYIGKELLGVNRLNATLVNSPDEKPLLDKTVYLRGLRNFDHDQRHHEHEEIQYEAEVRKALEVTQTESLLELLNKIASGQLKQQ